jgi:hypothetical protein
VQKSSASPLTRRQSHQPLSSSSDARAAHGASPFQKATPEKLDHPTSQQITREQNPSPKGLPSRLPSRSSGASGRPRRVPENDDGGEGSTGYHAELAAPGAPSGKEIARLEDGPFVELVRQLSETLVTKNERDWRIAQLTDELALTRAVLKLAQANTAILEERAGQELRRLQAKLNDSLLSRDHALKQAQSALQKASCAAEANEQSQRELTEMRAELEASKSESAVFRSRLAETENGCTKSKAEADTYCNQIATGLANMVEDRVLHRLMERVKALEAKMASSGWNEKSFEMMECRNEG